MKKLAKDFLVLVCQVNAKSINIVCMIITNEGKLIFFLYIVSDRIFVRAYEKRAKIKSCYYRSKEDPISWPSLLFWRVWTMWLSSYPTYKSSHLFFLYRVKIYYYFYLRVLTFLIYSIVFGLRWCRITLLAFKSVQIFTCAVKLIGSFWWRWFEGMSYRMYSTVGMCFWAKTL